MKFQGQLPHWRARGPPARLTWAKLPTQGALLSGAAFASGGAFVRGTALALVLSHSALATRLCLTWEMWMLWRSPRQTCSCRDRA